MQRPFLGWSVLLPLVLWAGACDNVGRAFDPSSNGNNGGGTTPTTGPPPIELMPVGGDSHAVRPLVRSVAPKGGGWPVTVPIVVEFNESMNQGSIKASTGNEAKLIVRAKGTTQSLATALDFLLSGRVAILRPNPPLANTPNTSYEVVLKTGARSVDGLTFAGTADQVLAEFTVDEAANVSNGEILAVLPHDNLTDVPCESESYVVFTKPPIPTSVTSASLQLRPTGGAALTVALSEPLKVSSFADPRVYKLVPTPAMAGSTQHELVVDETITFGTSGHLVFGNRVPFSRFTTVRNNAPAGVTVGNAAAGYADKINIGNLANLALHVDLPASTVAGDRVVARIYGLDHSTASTTDLAFVERAVVASVAGAQTVTVDFSGALGAIGRLVFDEGAVTFTAQLQTGDQHTGFIRGVSANDPRLDVTPPVLVRIGPPGVAGSNDAFTDQESLLLYGTASEQLSGALLTIGSATATMFASAADGTFLLKPVFLGRQAAPIAYTLTFSDIAGNLVAAAVNGNVAQRGVVTGAQAGTLTVEAFDQSTLLPVAGTTVVLDPNTPTVPATGQLVATTGADGRATFTGLTASRHTITVINAAYSLRTLYDTGAAYASLPMRPLVGATATAKGSVAVAAGFTALVGNSAWEDSQVLAVTTATTNPTKIPSTPIWPNRLQVITAFGGNFEPTTFPTFISHGCLMLGATLTTPTTPAAPVAGDADSSQSVTLVGASGVGSLISAYSKDLALAVGLDTTTLEGGGPRVRVMSSLVGFSVQSLTGVGFSVRGSGDVYTISASYSLPIILGLGPFNPTTWVATEARDALGRMARHRALLVPTTGAFLDLLPMPAIPVVRAQPAPSVGSPSVNFVDALDASSLPAGLAMGEVSARDAVGRRWLMLYEDLDAAGGLRTVQFPDLTNVGVPGLQAGIWSIRAEARLFLSATLSPGELVLAERIRQEVTYARADAANYTVQ